MTISQVREIEDIKYKYQQHQALSFRVIEREWLVALDNLSKANITANNKFPLSLYSVSILCLVAIIFVARQTMQKGENTEI